MLRITLGLIFASKPLLNRNRRSTLIQVKGIEGRLQGAPDTMQASAALLRPYFQPRLSDAGIRGVELDQRARLKK